MKTPSRQRVVRCHVGKPLQLDIDERKALLRLYRNDTMTDPDQLNEKVTCYMRRRDRGSKRSGGGVKGNGQKDKKTE